MCIWIIDRSPKCSADKASVVSTWRLYAEFIGYYCRYENLRTGNDIWFMFFVCITRTLIDANSNRCDVFIYTVIIFVWLNWKNSIHSMSMKSQEFVSNFNAFDFIVLAFIFAAIFILNKHFIMPTLHGPMDHIKYEIIPLDKKILRRAKYKFLREEDMECIADLDSTENTVALFNGLIINLLFSQPRQIQLELAIGNLFNSMWMLRAKGWERNGNTKEFYFLGGK